MPAPIQFGRYLLLERLAVGGMAEIFLAKAMGPSGFERLCVVKRALPHLSEDPEFVRMFMDEARVAAKLHHPGIVQIHDLGWSDGHYIAMEYLAGEDLAAVLVWSRKKGRPVPLEVATRVIISASEALHFAHTFEDPVTGPMRIVHRDVSPSNLFLTFHGDVKVLDFGVARAEGRLATTLAGVTKGKLSYMSPEQAQGLQVDARTDVWALGLCLRELITGRRLFAGHTAPLERLRHIVQAPVLPPGAERHDVPPELDRITMRALQRDPDERYLTAAELAADLEGLLSNAPPGFGKLTPAEYLQQLYGDDHIRAKTSPQLASEQHSSDFVPPGTLRLEAPEPVPGELPAPTTQPLAAQQSPAREGSGHHNQTVTSESSPRRPPPIEEADPFAAAPMGAAEPRQGEAFRRSPDAEVLPPPPSASRWRRALVVSGLLAFSALVFAGVAQTWWQTAPERTERREMTSEDPARVPDADPGAHLRHVTPVRGQPPAAVTATAPEEPGDAVEAPSLGSGGSAFNGEPVAAQLRIGDGEAPSGLNAPSPSRSKKSRAARTTGTGTLTIRANVPVDAFLGGRRLGPVPIEAARVPAGRHTLRLVNAERGLTHQSTVRVGSGRSTLHEVELGTGTLNVDAIPWAEVWIDGRKLGLTPLAGHVLWEGPHRVRLVGPEATRQLTVRIRAGRVSAVREDLRASTAAR